MEEYNLLMDISYGNYLKENQLEAIPENKVEDWKTALINEYMFNLTPEVVKTSFNVPEERRSDVEHRKYSVIADDEVYEDDANQRLKIKLKLVFNK